MICFGDLFGCVGRHTRRLAGTMSNMFRIIAAVCMCVCMCARTCVGLCAHLGIPEKRESIGLYGPLSFNGGVVLMLTNCQDFLPLFCSVRCTLCYLPYRADYCWRCWY